MRLTIDGKLRIIQDVDVWNEEFFDGTYKGYGIYCCRQDDGRVYIQVTHIDSGSIAYDGIAPLAVYDMCDAVAEAICGARILTKGE